MIIWPEIKWTSPVAIHLHADPASECHLHKSVAALDATGGQ